MTPTLLLPLRQRRSWISRSHHCRHGNIARWRRVARYLGIASRIPIGNRSSRRVLRKSGASGCTMTQLRCSTGLSSLARRLSTCVSCTRTRTRLCAALALTRRFLWRPSLGSWSKDPGICLVKTSSETRARPHYLKIVFTSSSWFASAWAGLLNKATSRQPSSTVLSCFAP